MLDANVRTECGSDRLTVTDSRTYAKRIRRRRKCLNCGSRMTTYEISQTDFEKLERYEKLIRNLISEESEYGN